MATPKQFPQDGGVQIGVVVGQGGVSDTVQDPMKVGNIQVLSPTEHSPMGVDPNHLALSPQVRKTQSEFPRPPDPGSLVYGLKTTGRNDVLVLGQATDGVNPTMSTPGNRNLFTANPHLMEAFNRQLEMFPMPDFEEKQERGALIREVKEKGKQYAHSLLQGLPSQASLYQMAGQAQPAIKDIETAKEHFTNIAGLSQLQGLAGKFMSMGQMFAGMSGSQKAAVKKNMPPDVAAGLESLMFLMPAIEGGGSYASNRKVHEETFMANAVELLSQCTSLADIDAVLGRLQWDETLFGLDQLEDITIEIETPFGNVTQVMTASGSLSVANSNTTNTTSASKSSFASFMSSASGAPGVVPGENMFGDSAGTMFDMMQRVFPEGLAKAKEVLEGVHKNDNAPKRNKIAQFPVSGYTLSDIGSLLG